MATGRIFRKHAFCYQDKPALRLLRQHWKDGHISASEHSKLRNLYLTLTEIESDYGQEEIEHFTKTIHAYSGLPREFIPSGLRFLEELGLCEVEEIRDEQGRFRGRVVKLLDITEKDDVQKSANGSSVSFCETTQTQTNDVRKTVNGKTVNGKTVNGKSGNGEVGAMDCENNDLIPDLFAFKKLDNSKKLDNHKKLDTHNKDVSENLTSREFVDLYNKLVASTVGLPRVDWENLSRKEKDKIRTRLREHPRREFWIQVCEKIRASPFLRGERGNWSGATIGWLVKNDANCVKVFRGEYDNRRVSGVRRWLERKRREAQEVSANWEEVFEGVLPNRREDNGSG